jgi:hypothetical protein
MAMVYTNGVYLNSQPTPTPTIAMLFSWRFTGSFAAGIYSLPDPTQNPGTIAQTPNTSPLSAPTQIGPKLGTGATFTTTLAVFRNPTTATGTPGYMSGSLCYLYNVTKGASIANTSLTLPGANIYSQAIAINGCFVSGKISPGDVLGLQITGSYSGTAAAVTLEVFGYWTTF